MSDQHPLTEQATGYISGTPEEVSEELYRREERLGGKLVAIGAENIFGKEALQEMNEHMEQVRREYIIKAAQSERDAAKVILGPGPHNPPRRKENTESLDRLIKEHTTTFAQAPHAYLAPKSLPKEYTLHARIRDPETEKPVFVQPATGYQILPL